MAPASFESWRWLCLRARAPQPPGSTSAKRRAACIEIAVVAAATAVRDLLDILPSVAAAVPARRASDMFPTVSSVRFAATGKSLVGLLLLPPAGGLFGGPAESDAAAAKTAWEVSPVTSMAGSDNAGLVVGSSSFKIHWVHSVMHIMLASDRTARACDGLRGVFMSRKTRSTACRNEIGKQNVLVEKL